MKHGVHARAPHAPCPDLTPHDAHMTSDGRCPGPRVLAVVNLNLDLPDFPPDDVPEQAWHAVLSVAVTARALGSSAGRTEHDGIRYGATRSIYGPAAHLWSVTAYT